MGHTVAMRLCAFKTAMTAHMSIGNKMECTGMPERRSIFWYNFNFGSDPENAKLFYQKSYT
jgi:hypothetical protein